MVIIFAFYTSNYTLWNKKKIENRVVLKPKRSAYAFYPLNPIIKIAHLVLFHCRLSSLERICHQNQFLLIFYYVHTFIDLSQSPFNPVVFSHNHFQFPLALMLMQWPMKSYFILCLL